MKSPLYTLFNMPAALFDCQVHALHEAVLQREQHVMSDQMECLLYSVSGIIHIRWLRLVDSILDVAPKEKV